MVNTRDAFIVDLNAQLDQLEEQVGALTLELNNAHEQLHFQQAQQDAFHAPPDVMDMDGEDEPEDIQGVSDLDFEVAAPSPAQLGAHSPVASEASVNNFYDF
jgi:hypothetical protein